MREIFEGMLCVYRYGSEEYLRAFVKLDDGRNFEYDRSPKCFSNLINDGIKNVVRVQFSANSDGRNPRKVRVLSDFM